MPPLLLLLAALAARGVLADLVFIVDNCLCGNMEENCTRYGRAELAPLAAIRDQAPGTTHLYAIRRGAPHYIGSDIPVLADGFDQVRGATDLLDDFYQLQLCNKIIDSRKGHMPQ